MTLTRALSCRSLQQGESATDIAKRKSFGEVLEILQNPVPRRISVRNQDHHQKHQKKRDKDSGTSKDSKDSGSRHKGKHKKVLYQLVT